MKLKKILASILAVAMVLSTMGTVAFAAEPDYVAKLAGTDICFENLADAFTTEHNPENKQVMLLKDYTGDLVINNNRVNVFYLENYTFTGQIKVELGGLTLYGQTTISQGRGRIENTGIDGNYPLCFDGENSNHINISNCDIVATEENGVALYSDSMSVKINLGEKTTGENVNITGDVVLEDGFLNIATGNTVNGDFDVTNGTLNISGGIFTSDVTGFLATGKMVADNGDGTYSVVVDPAAATLADLTLEDGAYLINNAYDFILFRNLIEAGQTGSNVFKITGEIDLDGYTLTGGSDQRFNGTLDGQGNTIKNVTINAAGKSNVGLINNLGAPGVVKNVTLQNVTVDGSTFVGALVGRSRSTSAVDNCHVTGTVDVDGSQHVGALMGNTVNSVTNCSVDATGAVSGSASVGGLVGTLTSVKGEIKGNSVSGISVNGNSAVGGIAGNMQPGGVVIENNSVNSVEINGNSSAGLVLGWIFDNGNEMTVSNNSASESILNGEASSDLYGEIDGSATAAIKVSFANAKDENDKDIAGLYNIILDPADDAEIYEFVGAELTFQNSSTTAASATTVMNYEILGIDGKTNAEKSIEKADTYALRLVDDAERMSGKGLVIGQVKFYGQGNITFTVLEGEVVTTKYGTNLGQYYTLDTDDTTADNLTVNGITNNIVEEVTRDVVVNVAFNHKVRDIQYWDNDMFTVTVKDGFGNVETKDLEITSVATGACNFTVKLAEDAGRITVTLEAPGYRKYVYNTTVEPGTDPLVLNFWNNVKRNEEFNGVVIDPEAEIEAGTNKKYTHNFVAGDIVMDYTVDKYDLAAVTSYYGTYDINKAEADKYIKYDLNRDGDIDIRDVHYVLHTLNN